MSRECDLEKRINPPGEYCGSISQFNRDRFTRFNRSANIFHSSLHTSVEEDWTPNTEFVCPTDAKKKRSWMLAVCWVEAQSWLDTVNCRGSIDTRHSSLAPSMMTSILRVWPAGQQLLCSSKRKGRKWGELRSRPAGQRYPAAGECILYTKAPFTQTYFFDALFSRIKDARLRHEAFTRCNNSVKKRA
jgi:hypothetical protein